MGKTTVRTSKSPRKEIRPEEPWAKMTSEAGTRETDKGIEDWKAKVKEGEGMIEYPPYKRVLFCTDFSETADYAFEFAYGIGKRDEGLLYVLHVIPKILINRW